MNLQLKQILMWLINERRRITHNIFVAQYLLFLLEHAIDLAKGNKANFRAYLHYGKCGRDKNTTKIVRGVFKGTISGRQFQTSFFSNPQIFFEKRTNERTSI